MSSWPEIILLFPAGTGKPLTFFYNVRDEVLQIRNCLNADPGLAINLNGTRIQFRVQAFVIPLTKIFMSSTSLLQISNVFSSFTVLRIRIRDGKIRIRDQGYTSQIRNTDFFLFKVKFTNIFTSRKTY
jgi:hypothetical protein